MAAVEPQRNVYVGHRYVPLIMGEWSQTETYEGLSIVTNQGDSYTSKKRVPIGTPISNEEYWVITGNYNAQIDQYRQDVTNFKEEVNEQFAERDYQLLANQFPSLSSAITQLNVSLKKVLYIPDGTYNISTPLTVSSDNTEIRFAPNAKIMSTVSNINAFIFTGKNGSLDGGTIEYPPTFDGANRKWLDNEAVVLVTGKGFTSKNMTLKNIFKVGFGVRGGSDCTFINNKIEGNFPESSWTGVETSHYGITIDPSLVIGGQNIIISENIIKGCVQGIFIGNYGSGVGYGINVSSNIFEGCHNHGIYANGGIGTIVNGNTFNRCSLPIAISGKYATITNNNLYTMYSGHNLDLVGISVREASYSNVSNNIIKGDVLNGNVVIDLTNLIGSSIDNNIVEGNLIDIATGTAQAIRVGGTTLTTACVNNQIKNNTIKCNGVTNLGLIGLFTKSTNMGINNQITGNILSVRNNTYGMHLYNQRGLICSNNTVKLEYSAAVAETLTLVNMLLVEDSLLTNNSLRCDPEYGANINLRGIKEEPTSNRNFVTGNLINFNSPLLLSKTELSLNSTSKSSNNMIAGLYVA